MDQDFQVVMSRVAKLGELSEAEAKRIVEDVFKDGVVSRGEAEALFMVNKSMTEMDAIWSEHFIAAIKDYLLDAESPMHRVTEEEGSWLLEQMQPASGLGLVEIELLLEVLRYAEAAPEALSRTVLTAISEKIITAGKADADMVERMRRALYAPAGEKGIWVSRFEATVLFTTNDAIAHAKNHASWNDLFARAVGNHLMARAHPDPMSDMQAFAREAWFKDTSTDVTGLLGRAASSFTDDSWFAKVAYSPKKAAEARQVANEIALRQAENITDDENSWFMKRLGWDKTISPAERALVDFLKSEAPGFANGLTIAA